MLCADEGLTRGGVTYERDIPSVARRRREKSNVTSRSEAKRNREGEGVAEVLGLKEGRKGRSVGLV